MLTSPGESVVGGSVLLFWSKLAGNLGFFAAVLILARALGPSGRGTIAFLTVTVLVAARLANLGMAEATAVLVARRRDDRGALLANAVVFSAASALVAAAAACLGLLALGDSRPAGIGAPELAVIVLGTLVSSLGDAGHSVLLGRHRLRAIALITASASWLYALLLLVTWAAVGLSVLAAALAWAAAEGIRGAAFLGRAKRGLALRGPDVRLLGESLRFGARAWIGSLARFLNFRTDQLLLGVLASEATLGVYAVAVNASEVLLYLPAATATALLPAVARSQGAVGSDQALSAFRSAAVVTTAAMLVGAVLGPILLPLVFGSEFADSVPPFLLLLPGALGFAATAVFSYALVGSGAPGLSSLGPVTALAVGLGLDLLLIPPFGASGAAAAASAAFLAGGVVALVAFRRLQAFPWRAVVAPERRDLVVFRALVTPLRAVRSS
jgi:O-antigen/teichoic acid export membrane protein